MSVPRAPLDDAPRRSAISASLAGSGKRIETSFIVARMAPAASVPCRGPLSRRLPSDSPEPSGGTLLSATMLPSAGTPLSRGTVASGVAPSTGASVSGRSAASLAPASNGALESPAASPAVGPLLHPESDRRKKRQSTVSKSEMRQRRKVMAASVAIARPNIRTNHLAASPGEHAPRRGRPRMNEGLSAPGPATRRASPRRRGRRSGRYRASAAPQPASR